VSCIEPKVIPRSILPVMRTAEEMEHAIGTLSGYAFLVGREEEDSDTLDMHRLVHMATKIWIQKCGREESAINGAVRHFANTFPINGHLNRPALWKNYLPHVFRVLNASGKDRTKKRSNILMAVENCLIQNRQFKVAIRCFEEAVEWRKSHSPEEHPLRLWAEHSLGSADINVRRIQEGILNIGARDKGL
jgi:hypothetical protein